MSELEKILKPLMKIADDETFCTQEYEAIRDYIEEKDFINVTTEDWQEIAARGYDVGWLIECYVPNLPKEKKLNMARQIWDEMANVPVDMEMNIDTDYRCWNRGTSAIEIWMCLEHWFDVSVAVDLMNM